jgi:hypothetical protein
MVFPPTLILSYNQKKKKKKKKKKLLFYKLEYDVFILQGCLCSSNGGIVTATNKVSP